MIRPPDLLRHLDEVERLLASPPFGLITDVDGTVSELAPTPEEARVAPACQAALRRLVGQVALVAAVSGRPAAQVRDMVGVEGVVYVGNHGLERWTERGVEVVPAAQVYQEPLRQALEDVRPLLESEGVRVEDKGAAIGLHVRGLPHPEAAQRRLLQALEASAAAHRLRVDSGKLVVELKPPLDIHKGTALRDLVASYRLRSVLYVGDDATDINALRELREMRRQGAVVGLGVGVLGGGETPPGLAEACDYVLDGVAAVCQLYTWLAERVGG